MEKEPGPEEEVDADPDAVVEGGAGEKKEAPPAEKTEDFEDGGVPLIYLCATCWHETEGEMLSLLKSLFRFSLGGPIK